MQIRRSLISVNYQGLVNRNRRTGGPPRPFTSQNLRPVYKLRGNIKIARTTIILWQNLDSICSRTTTEGAKAEVKLMQVNEK